jgi:chemotaxis protein MotB
MSLPENSEQPIIVKKIKKSEGHHGGAWKVAYADFVTAMMALFIVLWILSSGEEVKQAVAGYFKDPVGFQSGGGKLIDPGTKLNLMDENFLEEKEFKEMQKQKFEEMRQQIMNKLSESESISMLIDQIKFELTDEGLRIELVESSDDIFFQLGSSTLNKEAREILLNVAQEINRLPNKVAVEGHTDIRPFNGGNPNYTNYELSADRANSARRALVEGGLSESKIDEIRGYAANRLRDPEDPYSIVNRRISIIIKYQESL